MNTAQVSEAPLVVERVYNVPPERVWKALTDSEEVRQWFFKLPDFKAEVGFEFHFTGGKDDNLYHHTCVITEVIPAKKLTYSWRYDNVPGMSHVTWELFDLGDATRVVLTHEGLHTFPAEGSFARSNFQSGWNSFLGKVLPQHLGVELEE